ncbi:MAG TPA: methyltransferase domain-containing protein [Methanomicrobiales archaeon]|nr:methyltransferase domain-containing protein [Methanomicrobiales archaeon]
MHRHDWSERRKWQDPEAILARLGLEPGMTFLDIGCGDGFFAIPAANIVGKSGRVYGIDIDSGAVEDLKNRAEREDLHNIHLEVGAAEETVICDRCADIAFFGIDLHDFRDPKKVLLNAHQMIKPAGLLADLDWKKEETPFGPPPHIRFSEEKAAGLIQGAGFRVTGIEPAGPYTYLVMAVPGS